MGEIFLQNEKDHKVESESYLSCKEKSDMELCINLCATGKLTNEGAPFELSRKKEIRNLQERGVFQIVPYEPSMNGERIFNTRLVNEMKGMPNEPYKKTRMVVQGHSDKGKKEILTQSPTIQQSSQQISLAIAPSLSHCAVYLRDIIQAYVQLETPLKRIILARLPKEIAAQYPPNMIMQIIKPLYGLTEAGIYWY